MGQHVYNKSKTHSTDAKKIVRIITGSPYLAHTEPLMKEFKLLNISSINKYGKALFLYKYVNRQLPGNFDNYFINNHEFHNYDTRSREDMHIPNSRLDIRKQTIRNAGPALWNSIPIHIKDASTIELFKRGLKPHLLSTQVQPF